MTLKDGPILMANRNYNAKVLIVDDEPDLSHMLQLILGIEGYNPQAAFNRDQALQAIDIEQPDVILMDYCMPGLRAEEFLTELRQRNLDIPIILMTAAVSRNRCDELGLKYYLPKPFEFGDLLGTLQRSLADRKRACAAQ